MTVAWLGAFRPSAWVSVALFAALCFIAGGRTLAGSARGLGLAPELRLGVTGVRTAAIQTGYFVGAAVGGAALAVGGYGTLGLAFAVLFVGAAVPHLSSRLPAVTFHATGRAREESLSPFAVRSLETRGRELPEEACEVRTEFQRDRDRIVHSKPFRRLKGKTQVFIDPEEDHYRTRMTHTLEMTAISRVVARALRLNEDLVEAIGLGHDMGHTPFGHAGEDALDTAVPERFGGRFRHNEQSCASRARSTSRRRCATASSRTRASASRSRSRGRSCGWSTGSRTSTTT